MNSYAKKTMVPKDPQNQKVSDAVKVAIIAGIFGLLTAIVTGFFGLIPTLLKVPETPIVTVAAFSTASFTPTLDEELVMPVHTTTAIAEPSPTEVIVPTVTSTSTATYVLSSTEIAIAINTRTPIPLTPDVIIHTLAIDDTPTITSVRQQTQNCIGQVVSRSSGLLSVVRANPSKNAVLRQPIPQGTLIIILQRFDEIENDIWYQIEDFEGHYWGWIPAEYVIGVENCDNLME